jgi:hypothetical protein
MVHGMQHRDLNFGETNGTGLREPNLKISPGNDTREASTPHPTHRVEIVISGNMKIHVVHSKNLRHQFTID